MTHQSPDWYPDQLMETVLTVDSTCGHYKTVSVHVNKDVQFCFHAPQRAYVCHGDSGEPHLIRALNNGFLEYSYR